MQLIDHATITHLLTTYGYATVFTLVMLESAGIPLPGETILITASIYASTNHGLDIRFVVGSAAAGAIIGDNAGFLGGTDVRPASVVALWSGARARRA